VHFGKLREVVALKKDMVEFGTYMRKLVKEARPEMFEKSGKMSVSGEEPSSLLAELKRLNSDPSTEHQLSDDDLFGIYFTLFAAGTFSMSRVLTISLYLLTQYPQYKVDIRAEAREVIKDFDDFGYEELSKLKVLDAFFEGSVEAVWAVAGGVSERGD